MNVIRDLLRRYGVDIRILQPRDGSGPNYYVVAEVVPGSPVVVGTISPDGTVYNERDTQFAWIEE